MNIKHILAGAALAVAAIGGAQAAEARPYYGDRWHEGYRDNGWHRGWDRRDERRWRHHRRWRHERRRYAYVPYCWTEWRYDYRVRVCR